MLDGQLPAETEPPEQVVPPARPLGVILGWSLVALGVACVVAVVITWSLLGSEPAHRAVAAYNQAISANQSYDAAAKASEAVYESVYQALRLRSALLLCAAYVSAGVVPGLLYALNPSLLGGPLGRFLRRAAANVGAWRPRRRYPLPLYQGLGCTVLGIGGSIQAMSIEAGLRFGRIWLEIAMLLWFVALFMGMFLLTGGAGGFRSGKTAEHGHEQPGA